MYRREAAERLGESGSLTSLGAAELAAEALRIGPCLGRQRGGPDRA